MAPGFFAAAALAAVASLAAYVALSSPIDPVPSPPPPPTPPPNNLLQRLEKLGEGALDAPEDVYVDAASGGTLYTATRDGWLQRMLPGNNGSWERWRFVGGTGLLGIAPSADGTMLVCDADKGLLRVGEEGVTLLASEVDGSPIKFADAAIEASDGTVYFSDASSRFGFDRWFHDFFENRANGRLLRYYPRTGLTSVVLDHLYFANGVALPRDEAFIIVCEFSRFRCMKVWLKGEKTGQAETFIDNLPGCPDNIHLGSDGHFWIALIQARSPCLDLITRWSLAKRVVATFPAFLEWSKSTKVDDEGSHGGSGVGGRQNHPGARRLSREGDQLRHLGERVQWEHLPRKPRDQLRREIISVTGDTGAGYSFFVVEKFSVLDNCLYGNKLRNISLCSMVIHSSDVQ